VEALLDLGPRESGTEGAERAALHIHDRLTAVGCEAEIDRFLNQTPRGEVTFRNVMARIPGSGTAEWLIGGHYDTKSGISDTFVGANDSGSSTGVLIELARLAAEAARVAPPNVGLLFVVFDGEEAMESYGKTDGFHGSRHLADRWVREKRIQHLRAVIILDMIGDADLNITIPKNCDRGLVKRLFESAHAQGVRPYFELFEGTILDDHSAFQAAGVPAVDLIDFEFGSSAGLNDYWHTDQDTLDHISPQSLGIVGRVTIEMINRHSIQ
jgi:glutaminyl-peptide cyclotransferase